MPVYLKGNRISKTLGKKAAGVVKAFDKPGQKKGKNQNQQSFALLGHTYRMSHTRI